MYFLKVLLKVSWYITYISSIIAQSFHKYIIIFECSLSLLIRWEKRAYKIMMLRWTTEPESSPIAKSFPENFPKSFSKSLAITKSSSENFPKSFSKSSPITKSCPESFLESFSKSSPTPEDFCVRQKRPFRANRGGASKRREAPCPKPARAHRGGASKRHDKKHAPANRGGASKRAPDFTSAALTPPRFAVAPLWRPPAICSNLCRAVLTPRSICPEAVLAIFAERLAPFWRPTAAGGAAF